MTLLCNTCDAKAKLTITYFKSSIKATVHGHRCIDCACRFLMQQFSGEVNDIGIQSIQSTKDWEKGIEP